MRYIVASSYIISYERDPRETQPNKYIHIIVLTKYYCYKYYILQYLSMSEWAQEGLGPIPVFMKYQYEIGPRGTMINTTIKYLYK